MFTTSNNLQPTTYLKPNLLAVDSPGSSVFDLPTQNNESYAGIDLHLEQKGRALAENDNEVAVNTPLYIVISGGTGGNAICSAFTNACYVLPVSDDGGSSSEIIRVLGGPSVGDLRSRLIRLIPHSPPGSPLDSIRRLLSYRLPSNCLDREARDEWRDIVEGRSDHWKGIPADRKETIRGFLVYFESQLLKRAHKNFDFRNGSIGNYFLAAAQGFFRSLPSAIFLFSSITNSQATILPAIVTNHTVTIAAELIDGNKLVGQCEISHPVAQGPFPVDISFINSATSDGIVSPLFLLQQKNSMFEPSDKDTYDALPCPINRLYYINSYGLEIHPSPNVAYLANLASRDVLVYSCGSLWTSIIPCLAIRGIAAGIARSSRLRAKILLLNSENDRETDGYTAVDYVQTITRTLNTCYHPQPYGVEHANTIYPVSAFITDLVYMQGTKIHVDVDYLTGLGVRCIEIKNEAGKLGSVAKFDARCVRQAVDRILGSEENNRSASGGSEEWANDHGQDGL